jgi:hypothetical protein
MKNKWFLTIGVFLFCGLMFTACDMEPEEENPFKGTWRTSQGYTVTFWDSTWELPFYTAGDFQNTGLKGTYTYADNTASITYTEIIPEILENVR